MAIPAPTDAEQLRKTCAEKLNQWDKLKKINLKDYSVELYEFLSAYGYEGHINA
jgi:gas vesicle protein